MTEAKGDGGEGLYVRGRSGPRDMKHGTYSVWSKSHGRSSRLRCHICQSKEHLKMDCPSVDVMRAMSVEELLDWIMDSGGSYHITYMRDYLVDFEEYGGGNMLLGDGRESRVRGTGTFEKEGFTVKMQSGKIKVIRGSLVVLSRTRRSNCIYTLDGPAVIRKTLKGRRQLGEYQTRWKIKTGDSYLSNVFWAEDTTMSTYLVNRSRSSAIGFKTPIDMLGFFGWLASIKQGMLEPVKVKCIFLRYRKGIVGNKLWRLDDITSKVVLYRNMSFNESGEYKKTFISSGVGTGSVQVLQGVEFPVEPQEDRTFELVRDREQHSTCEMFRYREDSNEAAFAVAQAEKIDSHESLTFNDTVTCESKDYNEKLVQTLLGGHSILSLDDSLSGDCDVEKSGKWSYKYAVESQVYQGFCTKPGVASVGMGMLDGFVVDYRHTYRKLRSNDDAHNGFVDNWSGVYDTYRGCKGGYLTEWTLDGVRC
ncbi:hypothetical protein Tco_0221425 [Tanacetum coccineum]